MPLWQSQREGLYTNKHKEHHERGCKLHRINKTKIRLIQRTDTVKHSKAVLGHNNIRSQIQSDEQTTGTTY